MFIFIIIAVLLLLLFGMALLFGAPYLPTLSPQVEAALELLDLKSGDTLLELGSGDGRVMRAAAKRGVHVIGYEVNPLLVVISMFWNLKYRKLVTVRWANFWRADLAAADGIFVFLLKPYMAKLERKIEASYTKPIKLVSFAFVFPDRKPKATRHGVMLYEIGGRSSEQANTK